MARPRKGEEPGPALEGGAFTVTFHAEHRKAFEQFEDLRAKDRLGKSEMARKAIEEYVKRHHPGNPTIPLDHFTRGQKLSIAATEKLRAGGRSEGRKLKCQSCNGDGCDDCNGLGFYISYPKRGYLE